MALANQAEQKNGPNAKYYPAKKLVKVEFEVIINSYLGEFIR
jgi:hypothetical protein